MIIFYSNYNDYTEKYNDFGFSKRKFQVLKVFRIRCSKSDTKVFMEIQRYFFHLINLIYFMVSMKVFFFSFHCHPLISNLQQVNKIQRALKVSEEKQ